MPLKILSLDGRKWKQNYFRPKLELIPREANIQNLHMADGYDSGAHLTDYDDSHWLYAQVPGDIRDALIRNGDMPNPYYGRNSDQCRWVENHEWWLRREVIFPKEMEEMNLKLVFDGVDYLANYYWDGQEIGSSTDMFVAFTADITKLATPGKHILAVRLSPPPPSTSNHFRGGPIPPRSHHHKMQCSWGWDWVREINSIGIWDSVRIEAYKNAEINDVHIQATPADSGCASITTNLEIVTKADALLDYSISIFDSKNNAVAKYHDSISAKSNNATATASISLTDAQLWWPVGYGKQNLYKAVIELKNKNHLCDTKTITFGIRKIEMVRNLDSPEEANPLTFTVNGKKIFAAGANMVPAEILPGRIDHEKYEKLVKLAHDTGLVMIRVWGGGLIEKNVFYELCDEYGIMVWQEFPLSCSNYPQDQAFLDAKSQEADFIVRKLRNHPCLCMWCGGNEMQYYDMEPNHPVLKIFGQICNELSPGIPYHISCPDRSRPGERDHGPWLFETHKFWNDYFRFFCSEIGCNSLPSKEQIIKYIPKNELSNKGLALNHHFMHLEFYGSLKNMDINSLDDMVFFSQLAQADVLQYIMGINRTRQYKTSGCLIWQYNTSWPEGGWGIVEYDEKPKIALHWLKQACETQALVILDEGWEANETTPFNISVHAANSSRKKMQGSLSIEIWSQSGKLIFKKSKKISLNSEASELLENISIPSEELDTGLYYVRTQLIRDNSIISNCERIFAYGSWNQIFHDVEIPVVSFYMTSAKELRIINEGQIPAFVVEICDAETKVGENYFTLLPGEEKDVKIIAKDSKEPEIRIFGKAAKQNTHKILETQKAFA